MRGWMHWGVVGLAVVWAGTQLAYAQEDIGQPMVRLRGEAAANPERLELELAVGNAAVLAGKFDLAIASFEKVLDRLDPDSRGAGDLHLRMGETYRRMGNAEAAVASLTRASQLLPDQPVVLGTLALVLEGSGKKEEAERAYRATLQLDPDNAIAMNNLANLLADRGEDLELALGFARRAGELMPDDVDVIDTAGWVQLKRKQTDAAIELFARAVSKESGNGGYRQHLLLALEAKGDRSAAMDELRSLLAGDASSAGGGRVTELLQALQGSSVK
jgi:tetratricopeptide (TPR) repeat protein